MMVIAMAMTAVLIFTPSNDVDGAQFGIDGGKRLFSPGERLDSDDDDAIFVYTDSMNRYADARIVNSSGVTQAGSVSPTSATFGSDVVKKLTITAPSTPGDYRLEVTFYEGSSSTSEKFTRSYPIKVVEPIRLSAELKNTSNNAIVITIKFVIDGVTHDASKENTDVTIPARSGNVDGVRTVYYDWVVDSPSGGQHSFYLTTDAAEAELEGMGKSVNFYIGQKDNTLITVVMVVIAVILVLILIWIIRKPVKNFGKPKGRR